MPLKLDSLMLFAAASVASICDTLPVNVTVPLPLSTPNSETNTVMSRSVPSGASLELPGGGGGGGAEPIAEAIVNPNAGAET